MEQQVQQLVDRTWARYKQLPSSERLLIGISGIPGSGKTTAAATIVARLNQLGAAEGSSSSETNASSTGLSDPRAAIAVLVSMDGFHLTRAQLSAMEDPAYAHARRGAEFTFDGHGFLALVQQLRRPVAAAAGTTILAPSFDHAIKDPVADDIAIPASARIVLLEGNYISLDREPWRQAAGLMDERWFVVVDFQRARARLVRRHVAAGIAADAAEADRRVVQNDLVNGRQIVDERLPVDSVLSSCEDDGYACSGIDGRVERLEGSRC